MESCNVALETIGGDDMEDELRKIIDEKIEHLNIHVDSIKWETEGKETFLRVVLDADFIIDLSQVVAVTRIINPLLDGEDLIDKEYILDVYAKPKGDVNDEQ